jgi:cytochrome c553
MSLVRHHLLRSTALLVASFALWTCARTPVSKTDASCVSTRDFFERQVWASFMSTTCFKCHGADGNAVVKRGAKLVLQPPAYPGFLDANLANLREVSRIEYDGVSELLRKPLGQMGHGGGSPLKEGSPQFGALRELVTRLRAPEQCADTPPRTPPEVTLLDASATFRKAALGLAGRLPTEEEKALLQTRGDEALEPLLDRLMKEDGFDVRLRELFNDVLLTDKYRWRGYPYALQQLNMEDFPAATELRRQWDTEKWTEQTEEQRRKVNDALAREPLNLIAWVVQQERPFTEILKADYTVVDDTLAQVYGVQDGKSGVREARLTIGKGAPFPHAGILSTPMFVNRWPTTPTNRSRARARFLLKEFLATDILKLSERPVDVTQVTKIDNPTMNAESCVVCHRVLDPIAGGFRGWDEHDYERFRADRPWHEEMLHPGFGTTMLPAEEYGRALPWLASQIASDARFDRSAAQFVFKALTGREPLPYPSSSENDFDARLRAWHAQDAFLRRSMEHFVASNRNVKVLFKDVITSPYYRAAHISTATPETEGYGTARLLTPELLNRKIIATTGIHWRKPYDWPRPQDWLADNGFAVLYGGIDSDNTVERVTSMSSTMASVAQRMANETACMAVPFDLSRPQEQRVLFRAVGVEDQPTDTASIQRIRANLVALHERLLGERLSETDPEVEAAFQLFVETWQDGVNGEAKKSGVRHPCGLNPNDGTRLPDDLRRDRTYTVRAWMAVVTYLLSDYRFLYE